MSFYPEPCDGCKAFNSLCGKCKDKRKDLEGIFAVQPISRSWTYDGPELKGQYVNVARRQLPLGPARVLPLYSMQGMTAEPGLVAHWTFPPRVDYDIKWLICYVILSRVPSLPQLMSIGLSDKIREIIERVSGRELSPDWFPWNPIDSNGSIDGIRVTGWNNPFVSWIDSEGNEGQSRKPMNRDTTKGDMRSESSRASLHFSRDHRR